MAIDAYEEIMKEIISEALWPDEDSWSEWKREELRKESWLNEEDC